MPKDELDDIFQDEGGIGEEDETARAIRQALKDQGYDDDFEDGAGLDQPPVDVIHEDSTVSQEEGVKLASDARLKGDNADGENKPDADIKEKAEQGDEPEPEPDADADADATGPDSDKDDTKALDLTGAKVDDLLKDMPEAQRGEVARRLSEASQIMAPFQGEYAQAQMKRHGSSPTDVATRLVQIAEYAEKNPAEYLAWVSREMAASPEKANEVLGKAAELHGYKLVLADQDEDYELFETDEMKALREENKALKAAQAPAYGPDTPELRQQREAEQSLHRFENEVDATGNLKRPHLKQLEAQIAQMARNHIETQGTRPTFEDLDRFYTAAETNMRGLFGNSAAQEPKGVEDVAKKKAAAAQKAQRASTSIDGSGQGASRRPALGDDAPVEDVITAAIKASATG